MKMFRKLKAWFVKVNKMTLKDFGIKESDVPMNPFSAVNRKLYG